MATRARRPGRVVVLNGGSSAGKTTLGRSLQAVLPDPWLLLGPDLFIWALPPGLVEGPDGLTIRDGVISLGAAFVRLYGGFRDAVAALARSGANILLDEVSLDGAADQRRWNDALVGLDVSWVGVRCRPELAAQREAERGNRPAGIAGRQAATVHAGVAYDLEVDTGVLSVDQATDAVTGWLAARWSVPVTGGAYSGTTLPDRSAWPGREEDGRPPWER